MPQKVKATRELIWRVESEIDIVNRALTERIADWVAQEVERVGASRAAMTFTEEGAGPLCSWCGTIWGICVHGGDSEWYKRPDDCAGCSHAKDYHSGGESKCHSGDPTGGGHIIRCTCATYTKPTEEDH